MKQHGFSLIELMIALALLVFLVRLGLGAFAIYDRMVVRMELERLYMLFVYLQRRAVYEARAHTVQFDSEHQAYSRLPKIREHLTKGVIFGVTSGAKGPPSQPSELIHTPVTFPDQCVTFYPDGTIQAGAIYLTDTRHRYGYALTCAVAQVSHIRRYMLSDKKWVPIA